MSRVDELAERLWAARERAEPLAQDPDWLGVDHSRAVEVADQLTAAAPCRPTRAMSRPGSWARWTS